MRKINLLIFILFFNTGYAQQHEIDSLGELLNSKKSADTTKVAALFRLTELLYLRNFDTIVPLSKRALEITDRNLKKSQHKSLREVFLKSKATAFNNLGVYFTNSGEADSAIYFYKQSLKIQEEVDDKEELSNTNNNIGYIYQKQGKIEVALKYYRKALNFAEKISNDNQIAITCINIGNLYSVQKEHKKSLESYLRALECYTRAGNVYGLSMVNHNLASYYESQEKDFPKALKFYELALKQKEEVGDLVGMAYTLNNIGHVYSSMEAHDKALTYFLEGYNVFSSQNHIEGLANSSGNVSKGYLKKGDYQNALKYAEESYELAKKTGFPENIRNASLALYTIYDKQKKYDKAIEMYRLYCEMRDSLNNDKNRQAAIASQIQFKYDKETLKDSLEHAKENELNESAIAKQDAEIKAKQNMQLLLFGGLGLVIVFAIFMYNRFRITQRQNKIIEEQKREVELQKHIVEEKHKEITDSINYAERIQKSFLASKELLDDNLQDYFIYFKPKDVVSGDFYWSEKLANGSFCIAVADSTGHGVPGAIMSILNITCLENAVKEGAESPAEILNHTRANIINRLKKDGSLQGGQDGMDCALLCFDFKNDKLSFALANNSLWIIREEKLMEFSGDKIPVGKHDKQNTSFSQHEVNLKKGDLIIIFTDGYADQFGGEKGKKYKYSNLQRLILDNARLELSAINLKLSTAFEEWKGDLEQIDDICIVGVRI